MAAPGEFRFSPEGTHVAFLWSEEGTLSLGLWVMETQGGRTWCALRPADAFKSNEQFSSDASLARERRRRYSLGVDSFAWAPRGRTLLVPTPGRLLAHDLDAGTTRVVLEGSQFSNHRLSPDGKHLAFTSSDALWVAAMSDEGAALEPRRLTPPTAPAVRSGVAEYIAQEELGRSDGFWWHPSSRRLLFLEIDEADVRTTMISGGPDGHAAAYRYAYAGTPNARWRLGVIDLLPEGAGGVRWIDLGEHAREYLATAQFDREGRIVVQLLSRDQKEMVAVRLDDAGAAPQVLFTETSHAWINLHGDLHFLPDGSFLRVSEAEGVPRLRLHSTSGGEPRVLASPAGGVRRLVATNAEAGLVFFTGAAGDPREQHLFATNLDGTGEPRAISSGAGWNEMHVDKGARTLVRTHHGLESPPRAWLERRDGAAVGDFPRDLRPLPEGLRAPEHVELTAADGQALYGALYRPEGAGPFPLAVAVYGGPRHQAVRSAWDLTCDLRALRLVRSGIAVFKLDNRGTGGRGLAFEQGLARNFGHLEVDDQVRGVRHLIEAGVADASRVAIYGWSYGGYMAARCLFRAPTVFRAAVVGAPVVRWQEYDTAYTERYMGLLETDEDRAVYDRASVLSEVPDAPGPMLLVHGLRDENVLFENTARLVEALNERRHPYELVLFPGERHGVRGVGHRAYLESRIHAFLRAQLLGETRGGARG
ncbi:MAG TPA: prolyl oligopeptidase family serine peptidase [Polyangiaceae bacterium]|jgi:dipeptidyl-peptidase-4|nr:prolyl oligopeptidase family serine peptidase [Polyangiaceae bacterium]